MSQTSFKGLNVIDLTDLRGAMCGRLLADLGADVIKIQQPNVTQEQMESNGFRFRNANKRGMALDLRTPSGQASLDSLLADADILIENFGVRGHLEHGLEPDQIASRHPHLIHVTLSDFGLTGPRSSWHLEPLPAFAASGALHVSGFRDLPPCWLPGHIAHDCGSVFGAVGALAAVLDRRRHGHGQLVEISVQEAALSGTNLWSLALESYLHINPFLPYEGHRNADGSYWVFPAKDGWVRSVIGSPRQWDGFRALIGEPEELAGPEWNDHIFRLMNGDVIRLIAQERLVDRTRAELFAEALALGTTIGVLHTPSEFVAHPQTQLRECFTYPDFPGIAGAPFATTPYKLSGTPTELRRAAPEFGEHDATGFQPRTTGRPLVSNDAAGDVTNPEGDLPLGGVRVVEFGAAAVVPEMCGVLSELGADVIKVESLAHPDVLRSAAGGPQLNASFAFNCEGRGRRSVAIDITTERGRDVALALCATADIVAENFRGGVLERAGLGYEAVRAVNPSVIYVASQGYGRGGPYGEMPAFGPLNAGFAGLHHLWNHPEAPYPCGSSLNHPDHIAGKLLAVPVLAALIHRHDTGEGQLIDMAQTEAAAYLLGEVYIDAALSGVEPGANGNRSTTAAPHNVYPAHGEDRWIAISVPDDDAWQRFVDVVGWEQDDSLRTLAGRLGAVDKLDARLSEWTRQHTPDAASALLQAHGISAMTVMGPIDHHADAHLAERGFIVELQHPEVGTERHAGNPLRMSRVHQRTAQSAPCLGADTDEVLTAVLGYSTDTVAELIEAAICH